MITFIHTGKILPRTFARTIETLQPLKDAAIPCIAPFPHQYEGTLRSFAIYR